MRYLLFFLCVQCGFCDLVAAPSKQYNALKKRIHRYKGSSENFSIIPSTHNDFSSTSFSSHNSTKYGDTSGADVKVTPETWRKADTFEEQLNKNVALFINTMFPSEEAITSGVLSSAAYRVEKLKGEILQRMMFAFYYVPLFYQTLADSHPKVWPFPLAFALGNGQRVLVKTPHDRNTAFISWLTTGMPGQRKPDFIKKQAAGPFYVKRNKNNVVGEAVSRGWRGPLKDLIQRAKGNFYYFNLAFGGVGNVNARGDLIGADGNPLDPLFKTPNAKVQHGHFSFFERNFKNPVEGAVLINLQPSAPKKRSMYAYDPFNQSSVSKTTVLTPFGDYNPSTITGGDPVEKLKGIRSSLNRLGGMTLEISAKILDELQQKWRAYTQLSEDARRKIMLEMLRNAPPSVRESKGGGSFFVFKRKS